ncbi:MAG: DUF4595 domain-containing protein [Barnesiella sp.]|nr:DUF4595 domain-containing protein [Barnesiella sp.]
MKLKFLPFAFAALALGFTACSDDDDEPDLNPNPNPGDENVVVDPSTVFAAGIPTQVGDAVITTNADGLVTKISDGDMITTFDYAPAKSRAEVFIPAAYDMTMNVEWGNDDDGVDFYIKLNKQGFIEYAYEVDEDSYDGETADEWWFKYDRNGRMIEMKRTEGDNEITTITYNADGDIIAVKVSDDDAPDGKMECTVTYTNDNNPVAIANKSGIMLYDETLCIDMDEMAPAYFAGLLGKGTAHLPLGATETDDDGYKDIYTYEWVLNANQMPTMLKTSYESYSPWYDQPYFGEEDPISIKW